MSQNPSKLARFWKELKRRRVVHVITVYASAAFVIVELINNLTEPLNLPTVLATIVIIILAVGFPLAVIFSWIYDLSGEGIERTKSLDEVSEVQKVKVPNAWKIATIISFVVIGVMVCIVLYPKIFNADRLRELRNEESLISLAVLPFTNLTGNTEQEWMIAGQQETLITELSKLSQLVPLRVVGSYTVNAIKNYEKSMSEIANEINVNYLIEASVLGISDSINLQIRLIQVHPSETVIWAESFTGDFSNFLKLLSNIADQVAAKMNLDISPEDKGKLPSPREVNPESYKAYLRGMYHIHQMSEESMKIGLEYLHEAVRIDPGEPFAYAGLAIGYLEIAHSPLDPGDALTKAEAAVNQLSKLDTTMAEFYAALAELHLYKFWEFDKAEQYFVKALQLDPNLAMTHYHYAWALYLFGRMEEAIEEHKLAKKYDPFNPMHTAWLGGLYYNDGQYELAIKFALESFEIQEDYPAGYLILGSAYREMGREEEAIETHKKMVELYPGLKGRLAYTYARTGHFKEAESIMKDLEADISPGKAWILAQIYTALGNKDEAFKWLSYEPPLYAVPWASVMPEFQILHDDPRFIDFIDELKLPN
jgi:TolB-like protein/Tfp pilus assembly protein PilF